MDHSQIALCGLNTGLSEAIKAMQNMSGLDPSQRFGMAMAIKSLQDLAGQMDAGSLGSCTVNNYVNGKLIHGTKVGSDSGAKAVRPTPPKATRGEKSASAPVNPAVGELLSTVDRLLDSGKSSLKYRCGRGVFMSTLFEGKSLAREVASQLMVHLGSRGIAIKPIGESTKYALPPLKCPKSRFKIVHNGNKKALTVMHGLVQLNELDCADGKKPFSV